MDCREDVIHPRDRLDLTRDLDGEVLGEGQTDEAVRRGIAAWQAETSSRPLSEGRNRLAKELARWGVDIRHGDIVPQVRALPLVARCVRHDANRVAVHAYATFVRLHDDRLPRSIRDQVVDRHR